MDYITWSRTYWDEAARVRDRMERIRKQESRPAEELARKRRLTILYEMYLDCVHTAQALERRSGTERRL